MQKELNGPFKRWIPLPLLKKDEQVIALFIQIYYLLPASYEEQTSITEVNKDVNFNIRKSIFLISKNVDLILKESSNKAKASLKPVDIAILKSNIKKMKSQTEYAPRWVILMVSLSLGFGTMIGWKRIVVTIGEKIGKTHLTYAQGASAEIIAASTIGVSTWFGLPVSTTHVLSSGVAGAMVAGEGRQNLQMNTIKNILAAWIFTLPVTIITFRRSLFIVPLSAVIVISDDKLS